ncbi:UNVERIFIED_CONTAM: hypothetical protein FKN15_057786 [Acipenser sinensis]
MERRTQAVLSLKTKITATKENIRAMQARDQAKAAVQKEEERRIRESVRREGGDVTKYMYQQKRLQEFERQKQAFEEQKKSRKVEILSKILQEEAQMEKRKKLLPDLFPKMQKSQDFMPESGKPSDKLLQYLEMMYGEADDESYRPIPQDETRPRPITTNKMEQEILARTLEKHRSGIIRKQVVVGREFKGCPFYSKPDVIHFKLAVDSSLIDFGTHVGETISRTITLSNRGALGTKFNLVTSVSSSAVRLTPEPSPLGQPIPVRVRGVAIDVPVWVSKPNVDLKICMYDRLYQDSIPVHSRANTAVRATFEVCKELRNHMELLPKSGYIQARSTFNVQLKFLPRLSLTEDAGGYFDKETGVLEVPMTIHVADQTRPVLFAVHAVVTASDLEFDRKEVDFGHCSIHESVQASVHLTNKSLLPQEFGFVGIPKYVDVQPCDGFGILLPMETVKIDIIFSAIKAKEYSFALTCKSGINRDFKLSCQAVGVHPPLELSHSLVQFGATAVNDKSTATLYVVNSHTSCNEFTHPVPRIGKGEIAPVGPTSFEFVYPEDSDITITPAVGTVLPGKSCLVQVCFRPSLYKQQIQEEAIHMLSDTFAAAQASLIRSFKGSFKRYIIPCFVASGKSANRNEPGQTVVKRVTLSSTLLDPNGPFTLMNALRPLQPGATHTLLVSFSPVEGKKFYETLEIRTSNVALCLNLSGIGIYPSVTCSVEGGIIDFGYVLANESATSVFKLQNTSSILVNYSVKQDSVSVKKHKDQQGLPSFLTPSKEPQSLVEGAINPGTSQDITVTFQPDHESLYYSDRLTVEIVNKEVAHVIQLKGSSRTHTMFVDGGDPLDAPVESLADLPAKEDPEELNVEFSFDNLNTLQQKGFNLDPGKGAVDPGQKKSITVTWAPPSGHDVSFTTGDEECEEHNTFILLAILVLVLCGVIVSCIKFCRRKDKPPGQTLTELPCEISVVAMDNQSTVHSTSTVTSFNSVQLPPDRYVPFPFGQVNKGFAPPPYNLYALEMPPPYDEALKMPIDPHENSPGNRKADNRPSQGHAGDSHLQQPPPSSEEELNVLNEQRRPQEHFDEVQLDDPPRYELHDISSPISEEDEND